MKRTALIFLLSSTLIFSGSAIAANPRAGTTCPKVNQTQLYNNISYKCIKSGKKLVWDKGTPSAKPAAQPSPSASPTATPSPTASTKPVVDSRLECKLPPVDGRGDVAIGGFPRYAARMRSTGTINTVVVMVDFPDAPSTMTPQEAFSKISGSSETFKEVSYGKLNYEFHPQFKWYRMSKPTTAYAPLNKSFLTHRDYITEALTLADPDVDFSNADSFIVLANPDAKGLGYSGPAFSPLLGSGVTFDNHYLGNGATSAADLLGWGSIWLNHEITHTMGMVDLYSFKDDPSAVVSGGFRFTGDFSYMGLSSFTSTAPGLLGWERWVLGWIDDNQVTCDTSNEFTQTMTPIETTGGNKIVVVPISQTKAIVIESHRPIGIDSKLTKSGALVYLVDSSIQSGLGPIKVFPQVAADPKYLKAPRALGESVTIEGITVTVTAFDSNSDTIKITRA